MSGLALIMQQGFKIQGSDQNKIKIQSVVLNLNKIFLDMLQLMFKKQPF